MIFNSNNFKKIIKNNSEITFLFLLIFITIISTKFYNDKKKTINENYKNVINNIYFQKSINHIFNNLTPKYKNIDHKVSRGESLYKILQNYFVSNDEIIELKKSLDENYNLNNLKTNQTIKLTINPFGDKKIASFLFPVSMTKQIQLTRNSKTGLFEKKIIITNLTKKIIFKEGKILKSLYRTAIDLKVQPNIIIEFARIYGFQVDFQRDLRKNDSFQIMYEIFEDDKNKIYETGNIIFVNLKLSGINNSFYYFDKKGSEDYYDQKGKSVKKALMKTPINGATVIFCVWIEKTSY